MFLVPVSLKGIESVFLLKDRKTQLKGCDHSPQPERKFQLEVRSQTILWSFDVEKSWEDQGTGYMEDLMKHIMQKEGKTYT